MKLIKVELPFAGFYESWHDQIIDDHIEQRFADDHGEVPEFIVDVIWGSDIDWVKIREEYCKNYVEALADELDLTIEYDEMTSPREYNFSTNRLFVKMPASQINKIRREVEAYPEWPELIRERFTSRSGFWSFYSSDYQDTQWTRPILDECQYEVILEAWFEHRHQADPNNCKEYRDLELELASEMDIWSFDSVSEAVELIDKQLKRVKGVKTNAS